MNGHTVEASAEVVIDLGEKRRTKVLHVDDDACFLKTAKPILEMQGTFQVDVASSVEEAIERMETEEYDVVISDYQMPGKDGLQFLKELREKGNSIPFIVFTGKGREEVAIKALNLGADGYFNKTGSPETVYGELAHGISLAIGRKKAEMEIWQREERLRAILASSPDAIIISDLNGNIVDCNEATLRLTGYSSKEEIVGKSSFEFIAEKDREAALKNLEKTFNQGTTKNLEYALLKKGKKEYQGELSASVLKDSSGNLVGFVAVLRDITERKQVEEAIKESEEKYRNLFQNARDVIVTFDLKGNVTSVNKAAGEYGFNLDEFVGKNMLKYVSKKYWPKILKELGKIVQGKSIEGELELDTPNGKRIAEYRSNPVKRQNRTVGFQSILRDITERKIAEEALRESEEKFRNVFESSTDAIILLDTTGRILDVNKKALQVFGASKEKFVAKHFTSVDVFSPSDVPRLSSAFRRSLTGKKATFDLHVRDKKGQAILLECSSASVKKGDEVVATMIIARDITERRQTDEKFRSLVEETAVPIGICDLKSRFTYVNEALASVLGYSTAELKGRSFKDFLHPKDRRRVLRLFLAAIVLRRELYNFEFRALHKDGYVLHFTSKPTRLVVNGKTVGFQAILTNITEFKKITEELQRFSIAIKASVDGIVMSDLEGRIVELNDAALRLYGADAKSDLIGKSSLDLVVPEEREKIVENMKEVMKKGYANGKEIKASTKNGAGIPVEITTTLVKDNEGHPVGFLGIIRDLTERKKAEDALRDSEEKYKDLFENAMDVILTLDLKGSITAVNSSVLRFGYKKEDVVAKSILDFVSKEYWPTVMRDLSKVTQGEPARNETEIVVPAGKILVEYNARAIVRESNVTGVQINLRDVTERKKAEQTILESQKKFERLFMDNPEPAVYLDHNFHILDVNPRFTTLFSYSLYEVKGKHINDVAVPKEKMEEAEMLDRKLTSGIVYHDTVRKKKGGSLVPVSISAAPLIVNNQLIGHVAVYKDISQLKKTERELAIMNEKLCVVGGLTRHDVRNKLSAITGNTYLAKKELASDSKVLDYLDEMEKAVQQIVKIFDFAKAYEMLGAEELVYIDVEKTVNEAMSLFSDLNGVKVKNECRGLSLLADSLLRQLFYNLIDNSLKHGQKTTRLKAYYEKADQNQLKLIYEDDGVGIAAADKPKLFTEGYSTGGGSGYGLYLIKKMTEVYGWTIQETGEPGKGVQYVMTIPRTNSTGRENYKLS